MIGTNGSGNEIERLRREMVQLAKDLQRARDEIIRVDRHLVQAAKQLEMILATQEME